jgi:hypothetical protein
MIKKIKKFMKKNKEMLVGVGTLLFILLVILIGLTFDRSNGSKNLASVRRGGSDEHGECTFNLSCTSSKSSTSINDSVDFRAVISNESNCYGKKYYYWKDFKIAKSTGAVGGVNLSLSVGWSGASRTATCPKVTVNDSQNRDGSTDHECRVALLNGYNSADSSPSYSEVATRVLVDHQYSDNPISGDGDHYAKVTVRALLPKITVITDQAIANQERSLKSTVESWITTNNNGDGGYGGYGVDHSKDKIKNGVIAGHCAGSMAAFNYKTDYGSSVYYPSLSYLSYDPGYDTPEGIIFPDPVTCAITPDTTPFIGNGCRIKYAIQNGLISSPHENWTNGTSRPLDYNPANPYAYHHMMYKTLPSVLNGIPALVDSACPHLYASGN